jgi:hypothetical protein
MLVVVCCGYVLVLGCGCVVTRFGFGVVLDLPVQDLVSEGAKHLFSLCEMRHFSPVHNRLQLLQTVRLQYIRR